jgi:hypothetical protein
MAMSDSDSDARMSDDEEANGSGRARWESGAKKNWQLQEGVYGLGVELAGREEADKRQR